VENLRNAPAFPVTRKKGTIVALVALAWAFTAVPMVGQGNSPAGTDSEPSLGSLLEQSSKLEAENSRLSAEKNDLLKEDGNLQQQDSDLKARAKQLQNKKLEFKMDADVLQQDMDQYNAQCGGSHPKSVYEALRPKCEPWSEKIDKQTGKLASRASELTTEETSIGKGRAKLSDDTLKLTAKKKDNDAQIGEVSSKLKQVQMQAISAALKDPLRRAKAASACNSGLSAEAASCCHSVVFDGVDPQRCGAELIFLGFKKGGVFNTTVADYTIKKKKM
jgi:septal ring factor EnvC (AmiA/AmiB activator)